MFLCFLGCRMLCLTLSFYIWLQVACMRMYPLLSVHISPLTFVYNTYLNCNEKVHGMPLFPFKKGSDWNALLATIGAIAATHSALAISLHCLRQRKKKAMEDDNICEKVQEYLDKVKTLAAENSQSSPQAHLRQLNNHSLTFYLNTFHTQLTVPISIYRNILELDKVSRLYFRAWECGASSQAHLADLWNIICAIIEAEFRNPRALTDIDGNYRLQLLVLGSVVSKKFAIKNHLSNSKSDQKVALVIAELRSDLIALHRQKCASSNLKYCCTYISYTLSVTSPATVLCILLVNKSLLNGFEVAKKGIETVALHHFAAQCDSQASSTDQPCAPLNEFLLGVLGNTSGSLIIKNIFVNISKNILSSLDDAIKEDTLNNVSQALAATTSLTLAIQDYSHTQSGFVGSVQRRCEQTITSGGGVVLRYILGLWEDAWAVLAYPFQCAASWSVFRYLTYLESLLGSAMTLYRDSDDTNHYCKVEKEEPSEAKKDRGASPNSYKNIGIGVLLASLLNSTGSAVMPLSTTEPSALMTLAQQVVLPSQLPAVISQISIPACDVAICFFSQHQNALLEHFFRKYKEDMLVEQDTCDGSLLEITGSVEHIALLQRSGASYPLSLYDTEYYNSGVVADVYDYFQNQFNSHKKSLSLSIGMELGEVCGMKLPSSNSLTTVDASNRISTFIGRGGVEGRIEYKNEAKGYPLEFKKEQDELFLYPFETSMQLLRELWDTLPRIDNKPWEACTSFPEGPWSVEFRHVYFAYPGCDNYILEDISFKVEAGQHLGIIGFSGAGKTTILLLINRILAPTSGEIIVAGIPVEQFCARAYRRRIAFAWQDANSDRFFDNINIENNIALGDIQCGSPSGVRDALQAAEALRFVESRGKGMKSLLRTNNFSGGEIERLNIARALLNNAVHSAVLMLDESMSALDSVTESKIRASLEAHCQTTGRRTTLIQVTHRLASVKDCDVVIVVARGKVSERGKWDDLVNSKENRNFHTLLASQRLDFKLRQ